MKWLELSSGRPYFHEMVPRHSPPYVNHDHALLQTNPIYDTRTWRYVPVFFAPKQDKPWMYDGNPWRYRCYTLESGRAGDGAPKLLAAVRLVLYLAGGVL